MTCKEAVFPKHNMEVVHMNSQSCDSKYMSCIGSIRHDSSMEEVHEHKILPIVEEL